MKTKHQLQNEVAVARIALRDAEVALAAFDGLAENNVFDTADKGTAFAEDACDTMAHDACEGAGNCGDDQYTQDYMVGPIKFRCTASYEYDRHDKTYYYIDRRSYKHEAL